jgi:hypothetical protein
MYLCFDGEKTWMQDAADSPTRDKDAWNITKTQAIIKHRTMLPQGPVLTLYSMRHSEELRKQL